MIKKCLGCEKMDMDYNPANGDLFPWCGGDDCNDDCWRIASEQDDSRDDGWEASEDSAFRNHADRRFR